MTPKERVLAALEREPVDRLPYGDSLWGETRAKYVAGGKLREDEDPCDHFGFSWRLAGWLNGVADLDFEPVVLEETEDTILELDGNGARLRRWKNRSGTPEHVGFTVTDRAGWEEHVKPHLVNFDRRRVPWEEYRATRRKAQEQGQAFGWQGVAPFEQMHPVCGHEHMLVGMALDPDWVRDMVMTYADFTIRHLDALIAEEGVPDFFWFYEDMGFKNKPFMSPAMYEEIVEPGHRKLFGYAHDHGCKVVVHSCGFVEPLVPGLIRAGMNCLQAMEVKAGMDLPHLAAEFGDRIAFCGGIDIRIVAANDRSRLEEELKRKIVPVLEQGGGYLLHSDHSIPPEVEYDTLKWFFEHGSGIPETLPCAVDMPAPGIQGEGGV